MGYETRSSTRAKKNKERIGNVKVKDLVEIDRAIAKMKGQSNFLRIRDLGQVQRWHLEVSTSASFRDHSHKAYSTKAAYRKSPGSKRF